MEAPLLPGFKLDQTFFGFKATDRPKLHSALWDLVWAGDGKWDWNTIYALPIHMRVFFVQKLNKMNSDKSDKIAAAQMEKAKKDQEHSHVPPEVAKRFQ